MSRLISAFAIFWTFFLLPAQAEEFSEAVMEKFMTSLESLNASQAESMALQNYMAEMQANFVDMVAEDGRLRFFGTLVEWSVLHPEERAIISRASSSAGFASLRDWGEAGDTVFIAFLAMETPAEEIAAVEQLYTIVSVPGYTSEMSDEERANLMAVMRMFKALKNVPPATIEIVKPYKDRLSAVLN